MAGIGILLDLLKGLSDEAAQLATKANLNDSAKLMLQEILEELPKSDTPLHDYRSWMRRQVNEGAMDEAAVAILKNSDSFKTIVRADKTAEVFADLEDILINGGRVWDTDVLIGQMKLNAQSAGGVYHVDDLKIIEDGINDLKKMHGIDTPDTVAAHPGSAPTPGGTGAAPGGTGAAPGGTGA